MDLVQNFLQRYRHEYDFYDQAARLAMQQLDNDLQSSGIRAIVTSRAKQLARLEAKIRQRNLSRKYQSVEEIFADIVDLAGVRVALYFPGQRMEVGKLIESRFELIEPPKNFPSEEKPSYEKRFSGYWATHYRVRIKEISLVDSQKRYSDARIEIQVASVLMHAWSEVEHDLVYKPLQGELSIDEYAILDELNGLVLSGEIALERLQRAGEVRVTQKHAHFSSHYDLAAFLFDYFERNFAITPNETNIGRVDILYDFLKQLNLDTSESIDSFLDSIHSNLELRPISEQLIDLILLADQKRYAVYADIREKYDSQKSYMTQSESQRSEDQQKAMGFFLHNWIMFEDFVRNIYKSFQVAPWPSITPPALNRLREFQIFDEKTLEQLEQIRKFRNYLVHGVEIPATEVIERQALVLSRILTDLANSPNENVSQVAKTAITKFD